VIVDCAARKTQMKPRTTRRSRLAQRHPEVWKSPGVEESDDDAESQDSPSEEQEAPLPIFIPKHLARRVKQQRHQDELRYQCGQHPNVERVTEVRAIEAEGAQARGDGLHGDGFDEGRKNRPVELQDGGSAEQTKSGSGELALDTQFSSQEQVAYDKQAGQRRHVDHLLAEQVADTEEDAREEGPRRSPPRGQERDAAPQAERDRRLVSSDLD
jgi:hypothetical protein